MKFKVKETYLLLIIVMGLVSLSVYSTYALFTASTTIDDVVSFNATLNTDNNLIEYEMITLSPSEVKMLEINVNNTYSTSLYYGTWYQVVSPSDTTDIVVGLTDDNTSSGSGALAKTSSIKLIVGLANNSSKTAIINIGTVGSTTSNLNLPTGRNLIPEGFNPSTADLVINSLKINGTEATTFPINTGSYNVDTTCSNANITFNQKTHKYEISNISKKNATCGFSYTSKSNTTNLNDYLISLVGTTQGNGRLVNEVDDYEYVTGVGTKLTDASGVTAPTDYLSYAESYATTVSGTYNATTGIFSTSGQNWVTNTSGMTSNRYYQLSFKPPVDGYYQICYTLGAGNITNKLYIYNTGKQISINGSSYLSASTSTEKTGCVNIGEVSTTGSIRVIQHAYTTISSLSFRMGILPTKTTTYETGYRYEGKDPNNYIYFNNELWRIIGVFDETSHGVSNTNLVKIIRNDIIGNSVWNKSIKNDWPNSSLYHLLNDYYYTATDGTDTDYCYSFSVNPSFTVTGWEDVMGKCDYTGNGLQLYYRKMVQPVTWYLGGPSRSSNPASTHYANERDSSKIHSGRSASTTGNIGLIYASDYGYSVLSSSCARTIKLSDYNTDACAGNSWLVKYPGEWTITPYTYSYDQISGFGTSISESDSWRGDFVRPVVYLKSDVKYIGGTGTKNDPYIIDL